jgi:hypothetical protein
MLVPGLPLVPAEGRERAAIQLQLLLGQQVLLEQPGILHQRKSARVFSRISRTDGGLVCAGRTAEGLKRRQFPKTSEEYGMFSADTGPDTLSW